MPSSSNTLEVKAKKPVVSSEQLVDRLESKNVECERAKLPAVLRRSSSGKVMVPPRKSSSSYTAILKSWSPPDWATSGANVVAKTVIENCFPPRSVSAVGDFPPFCARNAPLLSQKEECQIALASSEENNFGQEMSGERLKLLQDIVKTDEKHLGERVEEGGAFKSKMEGNAFKNIEDNAKVMREQTVFRDDNRDVRGVEVTVGKKIATSSTDHQVIKRKFSKVGMKDFHVDKGLKDSGVNPSPFKPISSVGKGDGCDATVMRNKVKEILHVFRTTCRKLMVKGTTSNGRIDRQAAKIVQKNGNYIDSGKKIVGLVPGVEVGDKFWYRIELALVGLHRPPRSGIDCIKENNEIFATSIVASSEYADYMEDSEFLIYIGQGGNAISKKNMAYEDQKLERGNLALYNSMNVKNPIRVIRKERKFTKLLNARTKIDEIYTYDGLYFVQNCWKDEGPHGNLVYKFLLERIPDQPPLRKKRRILAQPACLKRVH